MQPILTLFRPICPSVPSDISISLGNFEAVNPWPVISNSGVGINPARLVDVKGQDVISMCVEHGKTKMFNNFFLSTTFISVCPVNNVLVDNMEF